MSAPIGDARLAEMQARCDAATPAPWRIGCAIGPFTSGCEAEYESSCEIIATDGRGDDWVLFEPTGDADDVVADAKFVATARTEWPETIAEVKRLRDGIAAEHVAVLLSSGESLCSTCCFDGDEPSVECQFEHDHGPGKPICATRALIA